MLELVDLSVRSGAFRLSGVDLQLAAGEYAVLMGPSGAGKSTLLEALCGLRAVDSGEIRLAGQNVTRLTPAQRGVGLVPQDVVLFTTMTVWDNVAYGLRARGMNRAACEPIVAEVARVLGVGGLLERRPATLSGGEARRVAIGRAIAFRPALLLLDEPLSALDAHTKAEVEQALLAVRDRYEACVLHVSHDHSEAARLADRLFRLEAGRVSEVKPHCRGSLPPDGSSLTPPAPARSSAG